MSSSNFPPRRASARFVTRTEHLVTIGAEPNPANQQVLPMMRAGRFNMLSAAAQLDYKARVMTALDELPMKPLEADIRHYMAVAPSCEQRPGQVPPCCTPRLMLMFSSPLTNHTSHVRRRSVRFEAPH